MDTSAGSAGWTEGAVNVNEQLTEKLRVGVQVHVTKLGEFGSWTPVFDWALVDYRFNRWVGVRAGKVKIRWGLYNDTQDADPSYLWSLLPESLYLRWIFARPTWRKMGWRFTAGCVRENGWATCLQPVLWLLSLRPRRWVPGGFPSDRHHFHPQACRCHAGGRPSLEDTIQRPDARRLARCFTTRAAICGRSLSGAAHVLAHILRELRAQEILPVGAVYEAGAIH